MLAELIKRFLNLLRTWLVALVKVINHFSWIYFVFSAGAKIIITVKSVNYINTLSVINEDKNSFYRYMSVHSNRQYRHESRPCRGKGNVFLIGTKYCSKFVEISRIVRNGLIRISYKWFMTVILVFECVIPCHQL